MAITRSAITNSTTATTSFTVASGAELLVVVMTSDSSSLTTDNVSAATYGGVSLTRQVESRTLSGIGGQNGAAVLTLASPTVGTADVVVSGTGWTSNPTVHI